MTVLQALILGLVQGLTELLPISSSAHLALVPWLLGWQDPGLAFDVALHIGTLAAILWYFRREWAALSVATLRVLRTHRIESDEERRAAFIVVASIPAGVAGVLLESYAESAFRHPAIMASTLMGMGVVLWAVDRWARRDRGLAAMGWGDAVIIGCAQVLALVPGVSRSGATMTAGRALRLDRGSAAVFSFMMSMPITAAAAVFKAPDAWRAEGVTLPLVVGIVAAALSSWLAITVLLRYVARHSFGIFAVYRILLGAVVFALLVARG